ncbi:hypothetical protein AAC387_Pa01g2307 [Persea americana]
MEANGQDDLTADIMTKSCNGDECPFNLDDIDDGVMEANGQDDLMADIMTKSCNGDECPLNLDDIDDGVDPVKRSLQEDHEGPLKIMGHITVVGH